MKKQNDLYRKRHEAQRFVENADRAEFQALRDGSAEIDSGVYNERVAGTLEDRDFIPHETERWHGEDLKNDTAVGGTRDELERRVRILAAAYPFRLKGGTLIHHSGASSVYEFFLSICNATTLYQRRSRSSATVV